MKSLYEVLHVDLAHEYTKKRKRAAVEKLATELGSDLEAQVKAAINEMSIPEDNEQFHWIQVIASRAAADLLTLGKVQPENMLAMAALPEDDFKECVKVATGNARKLNDKTVLAESELNTDVITEELV